MRLKTVRDHLTSVQPAARLSVQRMGYHSAEGTRPAAIILLWVCNELDVWQWITGEAIIKDQVKDGTRALPPLILDVGNARL